MLCVSRVYVIKISGSHMDIDARKAVFGGLRTTKARSRLRICAVWSAPLSFTFWNDTSEPFATRIYSKRLPFEPAYQTFVFCSVKWFYLRNRSAPAVNCWVIIHCLEVSCKEDQITSAQREWFIFAQLTDKQWIITQQFTQWSWSISILTHNKRRKHIRSLQLLPTFRHCTGELPPIFRLRCIRLHVIVTSFKRKNDVTPSNAMNDVIFQWRQLSHT